MSYWPIGCKCSFWWGPEFYTLYNDAFWPALVPESIRVGNSRVSRTAPRVSMLLQSGGGRIRLPPDYYLSTINSVKLALGGQLLYGKRTDGVALSGSYPQNGITAAGEGIVS